MNTIKRDFRSLDEKTQAELRRLAFVHIDKGRDKEYIADLIEVNIQTIGDWLRKRIALEARDFKGELRGRKEGEKRILTEVQEKKIKDQILDKTPEELKLGSALWTRRKVGELIQKETKYTFPLNTVGNYLYRWGLTAQRPCKLAHEQDEKKILNWIDVEYIKIKEEAEKENAIIKFSDEAGISLNTYYGKTYALKGKTPQIKLPSRKNHISMISSISNGGSLEFMLYNGGLDSKQFIRFLEKQIKYSKQKTYLIVDNMVTHKSKEVKKWLEIHKDKIKLFFSATLRSAIQSSGTTKQYLQTYVT